MTNVFLILSLSLYACTAKMQSPIPESEMAVSAMPFATVSGPQVSGLDSVNIDYQFRGHCYAYSSQENAERSNGEAHSDNLPHKVDGSFPRNGLYLHLNPHEYTAIDSSLLGCKLYLVNTSDSVVQLQAQDSRLDIVAEALDRKGNWNPISYLPSSWCGNSYHTVKLGKEEYWSFDVPIFKGDFKTKMRYTLTLGKDQQIHSNEVDAFLNKGQFDAENKQGHQAVDIMDPYND